MTSPHFEVASPLNIQHGTFKEVVLPSSVVSKIRNGILDLLMYNTRDIFGFKGHTIVEWQAFCFLKGQIL